LNPTYGAIPISVASHPLYSDRAPSVRIISTAVAQIEREATSVFTDSLVRSMSSG
jgi:hypothetical protein